MQTVLEQGSIDKPLTFDVGLIQLSFIPVCSINTCNISVKLCRGFALQCFHYIGNQRRTGWWCLKCVIVVYLARDIPAFVIYYVNGESGSSLLIESTDSDIYIYLKGYN